jgi:hypothetical protein
VRELPGNDVMPADTFIHRKPQIRASAVVISKDVVVERETRMSGKVKLNF